MNNEPRKSNGLWNKKAKSGLSYLSGGFTLEGKEYFMSVFKNKEKKTENSPDFSFIINPKETSNMPKVEMNNEETIDLSTITF